MGRPLVPPGSALHTVLRPDLRSPIEALTSVVKSLAGEVPDLGGSLESAEGSLDGGLGSIAGLESGLGGLEETVTGECTTLNSGLTVAAPVTISPAPPRTSFFCPGLVLPSVYEGSYLGHLTFPPGAPKW